MPELKKQSIRMEQQYWDMLNMLCALDKRSQGPELEVFIKAAFKKAGLKLPGEKSK